MAATETSASETAFSSFLHRVTSTSALWIASSRSVVLDRVKPATLDDQLTERSASSRILPHRVFFAPLDAPY